MKVALVNKNPAVSRLITLSLNKIGVEYVEFDDVNAVSGEFDYIIIDSDMESADVKFDQKVMYLAPRGGIKPDFADIMLEKPFLPTEFINLFEESKTVNVAGDDTKAELGLDDSANFDDFEHIDENYEELQNFELPEIDTDFENLAKEDETEKLDDNVLNDELLKEHLEDSSVGDLEDEEISLDEADTELIDENSEETEAANENVDDESSKAPKAEETIEDGLSSDFGDLSALVDEIENMDESSPVDEEARDELEKIVEQNTQNLKIDENDEELDDISQSKKELSEIDSLDEELNSEEADEENKNLDDADETDAKNLEQEELNLDELAKFEDEDSLENEINLEDEPKDEENLDEISEADEEQIQVDDEKAEEDIEEEALDEISSEELENLEPSESENASNKMPVEELEDVSEPEAKEDLGLVDEAFEEENVQEENAQEESKDVASSELNFDVASIDDIDENTMLAAFGLKDIPQTSSKNDEKEDYKEELTKKITKHVHESLNESSLRDVLKDMNIKINISFEEK
ncbi:Highly acidic protein [Campylobacter concisus]|uniref:Highly acidic protein n=1 Tax=Campylobacter concisus TaxID=199 RepID=UPI000CD93C2B|nr:Highly acidic protein [Campylobacter concisus]